MTKCYVVILAVLGLVLAIGETSFAGQTLTFDDLPVYTSIANGYGGFDWNNLYALNATTYADTHGPNGYTNGLVSPNNVLFDSGGDFFSISSASAFTFNSVYLNAAWNNDLNIQIDGLLGNTVIDTRTVTVDATGPATLFTFNWGGIDSVTFTPDGGTNAGYSGSGTEVAIDNLSTNFVPEPPSLLMLGTGTLAIIGYTWRRKMHTKRSYIGEGTVY